MPKKTPNPSPVFVNVGVTLVLADGRPIAHQIVAVRVPPAMEADILRGDPVMLAQVSILGPLVPYVPKKPRRSAIARKREQAKKALPRNRY